MGWQSVYICDTHWEEQEGKRLPIRVLPEGVELITEPCYVCGEAANIPVRRDLEDGDPGGYCSAGDCAEEGIVKINEQWYCLDHLGVAFEPIKTIQEAFRVAFPDRILDMPDGDDAA